MLAQMLNPKWIPNLEWILNPLALYGFLALSLAGGLTLVLSLKREIGRVRRSLTEAREQAEASAKTQAMELATLAAGLTALTAELATLKQEMERTDASL